MRSFVEEFLRSIFFPGNTKGDPVSLDEILSNASQITDKMGEVEKRITDLEDNIQRLRQSLNKAEE